jgi:hypothetical protein
MKTQITIYVADTRGNKPMHGVATIEIENWIALDAKDDLTDFVPRQIARIECHNERGSFIWPVRGL